MGVTSPPPFMCPLTGTLGHHYHMTRPGHLRTPIYASSSVYRPLGNQARKAGHISVGVGYLTYLYWFMKIYSTIMSEFSLEYLVSGMEGGFK